MLTIDRRNFLKSAAGGVATATGLRNSLCAENPLRKKLPVAAVVTEYRENSHADVIVGKILSQSEQSEGLDLKIVSMYSDQVPQDDLSRALSEQHGFRICQTIDEAITLGTDKLQVAGVLSIGEHGDYAKTDDTNQKMYPRRRFFDAIAAAFLRVGAVAPVFNDKHLAYRYSDAKHMYDTAVDMKIPFMAGSSIPVTWRRPPIALPIGCEIESAIGVGYGGLESYGFHAIEGLQCMIERRKGGERGISSVQAVRDNDAWQAERDGRWSQPLLEAALATMPNVPKGDLEDQLRPDAPFYLFEHRDGFKSCVVMAKGLARHFGFAAKLKGIDAPVATWFELESKKPYGHFGFLVRAIDTMIQTGHPSYPVERTLLTTGMLDSVMHSLAAGGVRIATPQLKIAYQAVEWPFANSIPKK